MALTASVVTQINATLTGSPDIGAASHSIAEKATTTFTDGTDANQVLRLFTDTRTLAASATEDLDLAGVLTDALGNVLTYAGVKVLRIRAASANTNSVVIGGAATNAFLLFGAATHTLALAPGGEVTIVNPTAAGYVVTAATGDILKIANSGAGTSVTYTIEILGD